MQQQSKVAYPKSFCSKKSPIRANPRKKAAFVCLTSLFLLLCLFSSPQKELFGILLRDQWLLARADYSFYSASELTTAIVAANLAIGPSPESSPNRNSLSFFCRPPLSNSNGMIQCGSTVP